MLRRRLRSHRFRRRVLWIGGILVVVATVVISAIAIGNTGNSYQTPIDRSKKAWVYREPASVRLTAADRRTLYETAVLFIRTAVTRKHLDEAWNLLGPEMKAGQTRRQWDSGFNNVVPFPAIGIANWDILYAYRNDVALDMAVVGSKKSNWAGKTFTIELKRYPSQPKRWLVAAWVPKGVGGAGQLRSVAAQPPVPPPKAALSPKWLIAPLGFFGLLLLSLAAWGIRSGIRHRRAARRYENLLRSG